MDEELRELERRWRETGSPEDAAALRRARARAGLSPTTRIEIGTGWDEPVMIELTGWEELVVGRRPRVSAVGGEPDDPASRHVELPDVLAPHDPLAPAQLPGHETLVDARRFRGSRPVRVFAARRLDGSQALIMIHELTVSRRHFDLFWRDEPERALWIRDTASASGTYLNGRHVSEARLAAGDEVRAGKVGLRIWPDVL